MYGFYTEQEETVVQKHFKWDICDRWLIEWNYFYLSSYSKLQSAQERLLKNGMEPKWFLWLLHII